MGDDLKLSPRMNYHNRLSSRRNLIIYKYSLKNSNNKRELGQSLHGRNTHICLEEWLSVRGVGCMRTWLILVITGWLSFFFKSVFFYVEMEIFDNFYLVGMSWNTLRFYVTLAKVQLSNQWCQPFTEEATAAQRGSLGVRQ